MPRARRRREGDGISTPDEKRDLRRLLELKFGPLPARYAGWLQVHQHDEGEQARRLEGALRASRLEDVFERAWAPTRWGLSWTFALLEEIGLEEGRVHGARRVVAGALERRVGELRLLELDRLNQAGRLELESWAASLGAGEVPQPFAGQRGPVEVEAVRQLLGLQLEDAFADRVSPQQWQTALDRLAAASLDQLRAWALRLHRGGSLAWILEPWAPPFYRPEQGKSLAQALWEQGRAQGRLLSRMLLRLGWTACGQRERVLAARRPELVRWARRLRNVRDQSDLERLLRG